MKAPPVLVECIMTPPVPTAQEFESLTMCTPIKKHPAPHAGTGLPVHVLPSKYSDEATAPVPPTAHAEDELVMWTSSRVVGETTGATKGALVQLKVPPFHLIIVGFPAESAAPTAKPSLSLTMYTARRSVC